MAMLECISGVIYSYLKPRLAKALARILTRLSTVPESLGIGTDLESYVHTGDLHFVSRMVNLTH